MFGYSRQSYYKEKVRKENRQKEEEKIVYLVKQIRKRMPKIGGKKMFYLLQDEFLREDIKVGRDKFFDILRANRLLIVRKKKYLMTTNSKHMFKKYPNIVKDIQITRKDQVWVSDITYIRTDEGFSYAAMITDAYTRKIVGYSIDRNMTTELVLNALDRALQQRQDYTGLIHHSDRGLQYCSKEYVNKLLSMGIQISMTENSDPYENALAERMNRTIKEEFIINEKVNSFIILQKLFYESVEIYNKERPHLSLLMKKPDEIYLKI